jgi:hypothetical protein
MRSEKNFKPDTHDTLETSVNKGYKNEREQMKGGDGAMVQWCNTTRGAESLQSLFPLLIIFEPFCP